VENSNVGQVLDVLRDELMKQPTPPDALPEYQVESAVFIGRTGQLISTEQIIAGKDTPAGLRLTMKSGEEYDVMLRTVCDDEEDED
jgi:hypothetical protein